MKTFLINSIVNFFGSPQGPARLNGYARREGMDFTYLNLNHQIYTYFLSESTLLDLLDVASNRFFWSMTRNHFFRRNFGSILIESSSGEIVNLLEEITGRPRGTAGFIDGKHVSPGRSSLDCDELPYILLDLANDVARRIGNTQKAMDRLFCSQDAEDFLSLFRILLCGKAIVDAVYYPAQLDFGLGFQGVSEWSPRAEDIVRASLDERHNYLIPYYRKQVIPELLDAHPRLIGLSASHESELIPVFTLAAAIKKEMPEVHVTLGGSAVHDIRDRISRNDCLWDMIDSMVYGRGEIALKELADSLEAGRPLDHVPNLIYKTAGSPQYSRSTAELTPDQWATPEFVGLRPGAYLPLETASSCYWGKCGFCYYPRYGHSNRDHKTGPYRERSLELVFEDMNYLEKKYQPAFFFLTDSAIPPDRLKALADFNLHSGSRTPFSAFIRLENDFTSEDFCRRLADGGLLGGQAGLETGTERVNTLINKGIDLKQVPLILKSLRISGILLHLYTVIGFPGETEEEALETFRFIERHHDDIPLNWQFYPVGMLENGPLVEQAKDRGISITPLPVNILTRICRYQVSSGLSEADAKHMAISFGRKMSHCCNSYMRWMDIELSKVYLLYRHSQQYRARFHSRFISHMGM